MREFLPNPDGNQPRRAKSKTGGSLSAAARSSAREGPAQITA